MIFEHMYFLLGTSCILLKTEMPLGLCIWKTLKMYNRLSYQRNWDLQHQEIMSENETAYDHHFKKQLLFIRSDSSWKLDFPLDTYMFLPQKPKTCYCELKKAFKCSTSSIKTCPHFPLVLKIWPVHLPTVLLKTFLSILDCFEKKKVWPGVGGNPLRLS